MANPTTNYVQNEQPYLYCNKCGRKTYKLWYLNQTVANNGAVGANNNQGGNFVNNAWVAPTMYCNRYNSAPALYPELASGSTPSQNSTTGITTGYCQGTMVLSTNGVTNLSNQTELKERSSS